VTRHSFLGSAKWKTAAQEQAKTERSVGPSMFAPHRRGIGLPTHVAPNRSGRSRVKRQSLAPRRIAQEVSSEQKAKILFAFCSPSCYFPSRGFQQVLFVASCSKLETCHPEPSAGVYRTELGGRPLWGNCSGGLPFTVSLEGRPALLRTQEKAGVPVNRMVNSTIRNTILGGRCAFPGAPRLGSKNSLLSSTEV
jgi:hypothetical protein